MLDKKYLLELFKKIQLFSSLTDEELSQIRRKAPVKQFKKNETILFEEDTNEFMYIILAGKVKVIQTMEDGKETILALHKAGDFFGEMSLIDGKTTPAMVIATQDTITAIISRKEFFALIFSQNKVLEKLLEILCFRLRDSWNRIQMLNFRTASQRLKMLFLMLAQEYGEKTPETVILDMKLTHQDFANMTGLTRETVTRLIDKWQRNGEIKVLKNKIILLTHNFTKRDFNMDIAK